MSSLLARYPGALAPTGFSLVQEVINTRGIVGKVDDLFDGPETAQEWLDQAVAQWASNAGERAGSFVLRASDLDKLRSLRDEITALVNGAKLSSVDAAPVEIRVVASGEARLMPVGTGIDWLRSAVFAEIVRAQGADIWKRLKICRNAECGSAFYDRSRNNSGVWHDVHSCGNAANLRASRERRKALFEDDRSRLIE